MTDVELCAQMTLMKALLENVYGNALKGDPEAFEAFMDDLSKRFRFGLQAPEHATADTEGRRCFPRPGACSNPSDRRCKDMMASGSGTRLYAPKTPGPGVKRGKRGSAIPALASVIAQQREDVAKGAAGDEAHQVDQHDGQIRQIRHGLAPWRLPLDEAKPFRA